MIAESDRPVLGGVGAHLSVQAEHLGLAIHQMGGFDRERLQGLIHATEPVHALVVLAVGRDDPTVALPDPFASRETAERTRLSAEEITVLAAPTAR